MAIFCKNCGKEISEDSKFCRYCGKWVLPSKELDNEKLREVKPVYDKHTESVQNPFNRTVTSKVINNTLNFIITVLIALNFFSGIIGGVWLTFSGGFWLVVYGILLSLIMPTAYSLAFIPQMITMPLIVKFEESGNKLMLTIIGFITTIYGNLILVFWSIFVFANLVIGHSQYILPLLLWGYSTVMAPLSYMASKEPSDSTGTSLGLLFAQLSYLLLTVTFFLGISVGTKNILLGVLALAFSTFTISVMLNTMKGKVPSLGVDR